MDIIEINEAFASQVLGCLKLMNVEFKTARQPNGGGSPSAIRSRLGRPPRAHGRARAAAVGRQVRRGVARIGVGQGLAVILERMQ